MGGLLERLHSTLVMHQIASRHTVSLPDIVSKAGLHMPSRLEDTIVGTFSRPHHPPTQIYVHWGAYESGKSRAARVAAARLQKDLGKPVMLLQGYNMNTRDITLRKWLLRDIGIPQDRQDDKLAVFLPEDKQALVILDHADMVLSKYGASYTYELLKELEVPVLVLVSSWEHALDLKKRGAQLLGKPGFARWTKDELIQLYHSLPESHCKRENYTNDFIEHATLAGCPGILINDAFEGIAREHNMLRSRLIDAEWHNGIRALNGEDVQGATGRFPDKQGKFHWYLQKTSNQE